MTIRLARLAAERRVELMYSVTDPSLMSSTGKAAEVLQLKYQRQQPDGPSVTMWVNLEGLEDIWR